MSKALLSHKGYHGTAEVSYEDDCLHGRILFIEDLITYEGATPIDLRKSFIDAVDRYLSYCAENKISPNKPFSGTFNVRVGPEIHRQASVAAYENDQTLNDFVLESISTALNQRRYTIQLRQTHSQIRNDSYDEESNQSWSPKTKQPEHRPH